jgi:hypothetical protein
MKKLFAFLILALAFAFAACGQTPAFKRSGTNLPFVTTLQSSNAFMVERGGGNAPANYTYNSLSNQLLADLPFNRPFSHSWASNVVTRGLNDNAAPSPDLVVSWWYIYAGIPGGKDWFTNLTFYTSNMVREFRTNGYYHAGWQTFATDGGWAQEDRTTQGRITWNTNYFENARLGMSLPNWVRFMHTNGWKVMLYSSVTTNACDLPSSPINHAYQDIQDMMSWGVDGVKLDHCGPAAPNNITSETNEYYTAYFRIVNQAVNDYYAIVSSTNGECRPFKILTTGSSGESFPNTLTADMLFGVNQSQYQPYIVHADIVNVAPWNSPGVTNYLSILREVQNFKPFFRRGHVVYNGIGVYGNNPGGAIGYTPCWVRNPWKSGWGAFWDCSTRAILRRATNGRTSFIRRPRSISRIAKCWRCSRTRALLRPRSIIQTILRRSG